MIVMRLSLAVLASAGVLSGCASTRPATPASPAATPAVPVAPPRAPKAGLDPAQRPDPFASTYSAPPSEPFAIVNATILTAAGPRIDAGTLLLREGKIAAVGRDVAIPSNVRVIDAKGRWITPGIVDSHSHIGVNSSPVGASADNVNEGFSASAVWIENAVWPQDPMFERALAAGVTTLQILPGSGSFFGGRSVVLKNVRAITPDAMKFPAAAGGFKMVCGENPTSGGPPGPPNPGKPSTRQGGAAQFRTTLIAAQQYAQQWEDWRNRGSGDPPPRNLGMENLVAALRGDLRIHMHCYRADDMIQMINLAREFGYRITAFHHANEAFKIAPLLAREHIAVATWAGDWAGYKMEAYDSIMETPAFIEKAGGIVAMHSDDATMMQHLNQDAGRALTAGQEAGLDTTPEQAIRWVTINPANLIGVGDRTGSLEAGKMADVVLWNTNPFSSYSLPDLVFIDGAVVYDRFSPHDIPRSDFELGNVRRRDPDAKSLPSRGQP